MPSTSATRRKTWHRRAKRLVRRVQHVEITIASSATTGTQTILPVDTGRSVVLFGGLNSAFTTAGHSSNASRLDLTNPTTVTATRNTSASHSILLRGCVLEFEPWAVQSVQQGTVTVAAGATSGTATINAVDPSRSVVFRLGSTINSTTTSPANSYVALDLTNATTVTGTRGSTSGDVITGYCVVEFAPGVVKSVQPLTVTSSSAGATDTGTLSPAVDTRNTFLVWGGVSMNNATETNYFYKAELTNPTTVTLTRNGTSSTSRTARLTAVELSPGLIRSLQRGTTTIGSGNAGATTAINPVVPERTAVFWGHMMPDTATDSNLYAAARLQDATTIDADRGASGSTTVESAWEAVEFL